MNSFCVEGKLIDFKEPKIMGILNLTPDSFYDGGRHNSLEHAIEHVAQMLQEGADIIDIGAVSSRPGAVEVSFEDELNRLISVVKAIKSKFPETILSIDTFRAKIVQEIGRFTQFIVNDISGFDKDPELLNVVSDLDLPYVLMHMNGTPQTMQNNPKYQDVCLEILQYFSEKLFQIKSKGVRQVIIDPGFGFGKRKEHNFQLLQKLSVFNILDAPLMVGLSRKSMIYKAIDAGPEASLNGTTALHMVALLNGATILRVHDVKEAVETRILWNELIKT